MFKLTLWMVKCHYRGQESSVSGQKRKEKEKKDIKDRDQFVPLCPDLQMQVIFGKLTTNDSVNM